jgi:hypothetical protein
VRALSVASGTLVQINAAETVGSQEVPIAAGTLETAVVVCTGLPTPSVVTGALVNVVAGPSVTVECKAGVTATLEGSLCVHTHMLTPAVV